MAEIVKYEKIPLLATANVSVIKDVSEIQKITTNFLELNEEKLVTSEYSDLLDGLKTAAASPVVDGKPRMLHLDAFMVHEGINQNGDEFFHDDLEAAVKERKLFSGAYAGMIDIDHEFFPVGYWYDSAFELDPESNSMGVLTKGAIWAWRFPEIADKVLAEVQRNGQLKVSMSCLCKAEDRVYRRDQETGRIVASNRNPVFLTTSILLDIEEAGDKYARAVVDEDPTATTPKERRKMLLKAASTNNKNLEEEEMLEDIKPLLDRISESVGEGQSQVLASITDMFESLNTTLTERDTSLEQANARIEELEATNAELTTQIEEKDLSLESLKTEHESVSQELEQTQARVAEFEQAEEEKQFEERKQARLNEVSETVRANLMNKPEDVRNAILTRWASQDEETWEVTKAEHSLVIESKNPKSSAGNLPGAPPGTDFNSLERFIL